ncbi:c-type cytochrome biogenesis protein CcsB [Actinokineospora soli]|uniref:C-type cytochrome biogenesis protein CcsB n=1 Tax=Actinokineospora soli TaxID=1048753 RepID=A0ABW2TY84_9PSEU
MPIDQTLAEYSDWAYAAAALVYFLALIAYAVEGAFGRSRKAARELVAAGPVPIGVIEEPARRSLPERFGRSAVALTVLGAVLHLAALVLRGVATGRAPWGNMYEYGMATMFVAVVGWLVLLRKFDIRRLGAFVMTPVVILLFLGFTVLYAEAAPVQPALKSYWLVIHVIAAASSSGLLLIPGVVSLLYLVRVRHEGGAPSRVGARLAPADTLDRVAYQTTVFAFPIYTFGIIAGAIWAESAWGRAWGWDPKEVVAFVAWVVYAGYLHSRATAGWRGTRAAVVNVVGFVMILFNTFFINFVVTGLHSYA